MLGLSAFEAISKVEETYGEYDILESPKAIANKVISKLVTEQIEHERFVRFQRYYNRY